MKRQPDASERSSVYVNKFSSDIIIYFWYDTYFFGYSDFSIEFR